MNPTIEKAGPKLPPQRAKRRVSFDEFMVATADRFAEWVDGEVTTQNGLPIGVHAGRQGAFIPLGSTQRAPAISPSR